MRSGEHDLFDAYMSTGEARAELHGLRLRVVKWVGDLAACMDGAFSARTVAALRDFINAYNKASA